MSVAASEVQVNEEESTDPILSYVGWRKQIVNGIKPPNRVFTSYVALGHMFIIFGGVNGNILYNDLWFYDHVCSRWHVVEVTGVPPPKRAGHSAVAFNSNMLVFGGHNLNKYLNDLWLLDVEAEAWVPVLPDNTFPCPRAFHTSTKVGKKMYVFGGESTSEEGKRVLLNDLFVYNPETLKWKQIKYKADSDGKVLSPLPRKGHSVVYVHRAGNEKDEISTSSPKSSTTTSDLLYLFGGVDEKGNLLNDLWIFDLLTKVWNQVVPYHHHHLKYLQAEYEEYQKKEENDNSKVTSGPFQLPANLPAYVLPSPRVFHSSIQLNNSLIFFGGVTSQDGRMITAYEEEEDSKIDDQSPKKKSGSSKEKLSPKKKDEKKKKKAPVSSILIQLNDIWEFNMETLRFAPIEISTFAVTTSSVYYQYSFSFKQQKEDNSISKEEHPIIVVRWAQHPVIEQSGKDGVDNKVKITRGTIPTARFSHLGVPLQDKYALIILGGCNDLLSVYNTPYERHEEHTKTKKPYSKYDNPFGTTLSSSQSQVVSLFDGVWFFFTGGGTLIGSNRVISPEDEASEDANSVNAESRDSGDREGFSDTSKEKLKELKLEDDIVLNLNNTQHIARRGKNSRIISFDKSLPQKLDLPHLDADDEAERELREFEERENGLAKTRREHKRLDRQIALTTIIEEEERLEQKKREEEIDPKFLNKKLEEKHAKYQERKKRQKQRRKNKKDFLRQQAIEAENLKDREKQKERVTKEKWNYKYNMEDDDIEDDVSDYVYGLSEDEDEASKEKNSESEENVKEVSTPKTEIKKDENNNEFVEALKNIHRLVNLSNATKILEEETPKDEEIVGEGLNLLNKTADIVQRCLGQYKDDVNQWLDYEVKRSTELWDQQTKKDNEEKLPFIDFIVKKVDTEWDNKGDGQKAVEDKYMAWTEDRDKDIDAGVEEEVEVRKEAIVKLGHTKEKAEDEIKETRKEREERQDESKKRKEELENLVKKKRDENDKYLTIRFGEGENLMEDILDYSTTKNKDLLIYLNDALLRRLGVLGMTEKKGYYDDAAASAAENEDQIENRPAEPEGAAQSTDDDIIRKRFADNNTLEDDIASIFVVKVPPSRSLLSGVVDSSALGRYKVTKDDRTKRNFKVGKNLLDFEKRLYNLEKEIKKNKDLLENTEDGKAIPSHSRTHSFLLDHPEAFTDVVKQSSGQGDTKILGEEEKASEVDDSASVKAAKDDAQNKEPLPQKETPLTTAYQSPVPLVPIGSALLSYLLQQEVLINEAVKQSGATVTETGNVLGEMKMKMEKLLSDLKEVHGKRNYVEKKITTLRNDGEEVAAAMLDVQDKENDVINGGAFVSSVINNVNQTCDDLDNENIDTKKIYSGIIELQEKQNKLENDLTNRIEKEVLLGLKKATDEEVRTMTQAEARADTLLFRVNERLDVVEKSILKGMETTVLDVVKYGDKDTIRKRENQRNKREKEERKRVKQQQKDDNLFVGEDGKKLKDDVSDSEEDESAVENEASLDAIIKAHNREAYHNDDDEKKMEQLLNRLTTLKKRLETTQADQDANEGQLVKGMESKCSAAQADLEKHEHDYQENNDVKFSVKESLMDVIKSIGEFDNEIRKYRIISGKKVEDLVEVHVREELNSNEFVFGRLLLILQNQYDRLADAEDKEASRLDEHLNVLTAQAEQMELKVIKQREIVREKAEALASSHDSQCGIVDARLQYIVEVYKRTHKKLGDLQQLLKAWKKQLDSLAHLDVKQNVLNAREELAKGVENKAD